MGVVLIRKLVRGARRFRLHVMPCRNLFRPVRTFVSPQWTFRGSSTSLRVLTASTTRSRPKSSPRSARRGAEKKMGSSLEITQCVISRLDPDASSDSTDSGRPVKRGAARAEGQLESSFFNRLQLVCSLWGACKGASRAGPPRGADSPPPPPRLCGTARRPGECLSGSMGGRGILALSQSGVTRFCGVGSPEG